MELPVKQFQTRAEQAFLDAFATVGGLFKPISVAGRFGAAPPVALATLALAISKQGKAYAGHFAMVHHG